MDVLWDSTKPLLIRELQAALNDGATKPLAYTTVQTVAERLVKKGMLSRAAERKAFRYGPRRSREEHLSAVMLETLAKSPDPAPVLSRFARGVDVDDALRLLDELARRAQEDGRTPPPMPPGWLPPGD